MYFLFLKSLHCEESDDTTNARRQVTKSYGVVWNFTILIYGNEGIAHIVSVFYHIANSEQYAFLDNFF